MTAPAVLVTGGSGYLGSFLVVELSKAGFHVAYTFRNSPACANLGVGKGYAVDLCTGEGLAACLDGMGSLHAIINCAAVSQPAACERDRSTADALNVPTRLIEACRQRFGSCDPQPLLIHLSTDQVYPGTSANSSEDAAPGPMNGYGQSKLAAEAFVRDSWRNHCILRSSIIYGPATAAPSAAQVGRALFLQWLDDALSKGPLDLFQDEFRNPVYVHDIVSVCKALMSARPGGVPEAGAAAVSSGAEAGRVFNMGGPERLSRADMGRIVARVRGHPAEHVLEVPSASVKRPVASPPDISMDSARLSAATGVAFTPFEEGVRRSFGGGGGAAEREAAAAAL